MNQIIFQSQNIRGLSLVCGIPFLFAEMLLFEGGNHSHVLGKMVGWVSGNGTMTFLRCLEIHA
jgi:hypothetical protein